MFPMAPTCWNAGDFSRLRKRTADLAAYPNARDRLLLCNLYQNRHRAPGGDRAVD